MPVAFQAAGGPSLGNSLSSPLSGERLFNWGPRKRGQSTDLVGSAAEAVAVTTRARGRDQRHRKVGRNMGWDPQVGLEKVSLSPTPIAVNAPPQPQGSS